MNHHDQETTDARAQIERTRAFLKKVVRNYRAVLGAAVLGLVAGVAFLLIRTPPYRSETVILYSEGIRTNVDPAPGAGTPHEAAVRLREMLLSRQRLEKLIDEFNLYPDVVKEYGRVDAVEEFREHIDFRAPGSDTYTIGFQGTSAVEARDVTAALARSLIEEDATMRRKKAELTRDFLAEERKRTDQELRAAEEELAQFLAEHPSFALDSMLLMPGASPTGAAIRAAEAQQSASRAPGVPFGPRARGATAPLGRAVAVPPDLAAEKARAEADLATAQNALSQALTRFTRQHPDVRAAEASVTRARARVTAVNASIASALSQAAAAAPPPAPPRTAARAPAQKGPKAEAKKTSNEELVALETEWTRLIRNVGEARSRHEQIESSYFKADIAASSEAETTGTRMAILDPAFLPTRPAPPGRVIILGIFLVLSTAVGVAIAVLRAAMDDRVYRVTELERVGLGVLAAIPKEGVKS